MWFNLSERVFKLHISRVKILQTILSESIERYFVAKNWKQNFQVQSFSSFPSLFIHLDQAGNASRDHGLLGQEVQRPIVLHGGRKERGSGETFKD
jgi:hypothetical protein